MNETTILQDIQKIRDWIREDLQYVSLCNRNSSKVVDTAHIQARLQSHFVQLNRLIMKIEGDDI